MKYLVKTHCLEWHDIGYIVEADSEEEARDLIESGDCNNNIEYCDYDTTDQVDIESIEEI